MTFEVNLEDVATHQATRFLADDPHGLSQVLAALDDLADDPRPAHSFPFGSDDLRRLRVGRYRAMYRIDGGSISVTHIARTPGDPSQAPLDSPP